MSLTKSLLLKLQRAELEIENTSVFRGVPIDLSKFPDYECLAKYYLFENNEYLIVIDSQRFNGHTGNGDNLAHLTIYNITECKIEINKCFGECVTFDILSTNKGILCYLGKTPDFCGDYDVSDKAEWKLQNVIVGITFTDLGINFDEIIGDKLLLFSKENLMINCFGDVIKDSNKLINSDFSYLYKDDLYIYYYQNSDENVKFFQFDINTSVLSEIL